MGTSETREAAASRASAGSGVVTREEHDTALTPLLDEFCKINRAHDFGRIKMSPATQVRHTELFRAMRALHDAYNAANPIPTCPECGNSRMAYPSPECFNCDNCSLAIKFLGG